MSTQTLCQFMKDQISAIHEDFTNANVDVDENEFTINWITVNGASFREAWLIKYNTEG